MRVRPIKNNLIKGCDTLFTCKYSSRFIWDEYSQVKRVPRLLIRNVFNRLHSHDTASRLSSTIHCKRKTVSRLQSIVHICNCSVEVWWSDLLVSILVAAQQLFKVPVYYELSSTNLRAHIIPTCLYSNTH